MRITSGHYKNRQLFVPEGKFVRPTSDRMRQSIFNILRHPKWDDQFSLDGIHVADLFCGSGSLGLEALSNGAKHCVFIDQDVRATNDNTGFLPVDDFISFIFLVLSDIGIIISRTGSVFISLGSSLSTTLFSLN